MWTELNKKMITSDGNVKRYINSDKIDKFEEGDAADISFPNGYGKGNRVHKGIVPCLAVASVKQIIVKEGNMNNLRIRKLTPRECWRLMGFDDIDFDKASKVNSDSQLYKQAGNSIVVNVLEAILTNLLLNPIMDRKQNINKQMTMEDYL